MPNFDLSQWQSDYESAPAERENKGSDSVPDGKYQVRISRLTMTESKKGNNPMLEFELDILGPKCAGRKLWKRNMLVSADNIKWLKGDLYVCGLVLKNLNDLNDQEILGTLIGVTLEVTKKTKGEYENVYLDKRITIDAPTQGGRRPAVPLSASSDDVPF
jgi:hypothetical protein